MNSLFRFTLIYIVFASSLFSQSDSLFVKFILARFDYQTMESKNLYLYHQPLNPGRPQSDEELYGELYVKIEPAGDFGSTLMRSKATGDTVYNATTIWDGKGEHIFPPPEYEIDASPGSDSLVHPMRLDVVDDFFDSDDSAKVGIIFEAAKKYAPLSEFGNQRFCALLYKHYFSVGAADPSTAEWIVLFYTVPSYPPVFKRQWVNIAGNLGKPYILTIAPHSAVADSLIIGTTLGAFSARNSGARWKPVKFDSAFKTTVTVVENHLNPFVMSPVPVDITYIGTTDHSAVPEERDGRIFFRFSDASPWENLHFDNAAVTAIGIDPQQPLRIYAAVYNPFYSIGGVHRYQPQTGWQELPFFPQLTSEDFPIVRINCITVDPVDSNRICLGTELGLYISTDYGQTWEHRLGNFNIVSIQIPLFQSPTLWAATSGITRSDGIYRSEDGGETWAVQHWCTRIVDFISGSPIASDPWNMFYAAYDQGVFVSDYTGQYWEEIPGDLPDKKITSLALDSRDFHGIYVGTETGIYKYQHVFPFIDLHVSNSDLAYSPPMPIENEIVDIYADIHNRSRIPVHQVEVAFYDNAHGMLPVIMPIDNVVIQSIPPDTFITVHVKWRAERDENRIFSELDPRDTILEMNETNNVAYIDIRVLPAPVEYEWINVSGNLQDAKINDISTHPFSRYQLYVATASGAFSTEDALSKNWNPLKFCDQSDIHATCIASEPHPFLDWTVPTLYVTTEEYTDIPEDRLGRVFRSEDGGLNWWNTGFDAQMAVTALYVSPIYSFQAYAGAWSPFYYKNGLFSLCDSLWQKIPINGDSLFFKINCIETDWQTGNVIYVGTSRGLLKINQSVEAIFEFALPDFNIVSIVTEPGCPEVLYAATGGRSKSDGVYMSKDAGETWEVIHWHTKIIEMCRGSQSLSSLGHLYLAAADDDIYHSHDGGFNWQPVVDSDGLVNKKFTSLAIDRFDPLAIYVGTEKGIFMYGPKTTVADKNQNPDSHAMPEQFALCQNYPNPFNQQTVIRYELPGGLGSRRISLKIYNLLGQVIRVLVDDISNPGFYKIAWDGMDSDGSQVESGIYFCQMRCGQFVSTRKLVLVR
ncbi:T9SS type A sorting domain-containing protein [candidate division KSB1 bacterium]|nr:T9SS type A sorting domain-containing protein [candidate division KSB1 bacterium]